MKTNIRFEFGEGEDNIRVETILVDGEACASLTIGAFENDYGGSDGRSIVMDYDEFGEFIRACNSVNMLMAVKIDRQEE